MPKVNGKNEFRADQLVQALLDQFIDFIADDFHDCWGFEVADILDVRDDFVTASFGKQAYIIALALVAVVLAQVENANVFLWCKFWISKVVFCRDNFGFGNVELPILWRVHDNYFFIMFARVASSW